jgi:uncharacterized protein YlxP (DUF503 family)
MDILSTKTQDEVLRSLLAETAKGMNEIRCARADLQKATSRMTFAIAAINDLLDRETKDETQ